jgi:hypothetical protein
MNCMSLYVCTLFAAANNVLVALVVDLAMSDFLYNDFGTEGSDNRMQRGYM